MPACLSVLAVLLHYKIQKKICIFVVFLVPTLLVCFFVYFLLLSFAWFYFAFFCFEGFLVLVSFLLFLFLFSSYFSQNCNFWNFWILNFVSALPQRCCCLLAHRGIAFRTRKMFSKGVPKRKILSRTKNSTTKIVANCSCALK